MWLPIPISIAEASFEPKAWFRAIYANETPVGFAMLYDDREKPEYFLWRFMIDARYQHLGFGRQALQLLIDHVRTLPDAREFLLSYQMPRVARKRSTPVWALSTRAKSWTMRR